MYLEKENKITKLNVDFIEMVSECEGRLRHSPWFHANFRFKFIRVSAIQESESLESRKSTAHVLEYNDVVENRSAKKESKIRSLMLVLVKLVEKLSTSFRKNRFQCIT